MYELLDSIKNIKDIKKMSFTELNSISSEIRDFLIDTVSKTGGHLSSNLGVVELTLSLYKVFNFDEDKLIFDVGHQAYVHKIITGRKDEFDTLRKFNGLSGFPKRKESIYDHFDTGHSSTSISAAVGMARARDLKNGKNEVVVVIGDGALTGGMAYEALNDIGFRKTKVMIILNDNAMSISENVGGMSVYLNKLRTDPTYNRLKLDINNTLKKSNIGKSLARSVHKIKDSIKQFVIPGMYFEDMGIKYLGPIDGHNIKEITRVLSQAKKIDSPVIIHVKTIKGKGYNYAENNPNKFHGIGPFDLENGECEDMNVETYSKVFGETMIEIANKKKDLVAISAAMPDGTGLTLFQKKFPERFFDVGIAEEHAVTMCAGMASEGLKPVFAVYSTFLQRAFDQIIHDVCIQNLPVLFAIDRGGIVGADGETHQGVFDLSYLNLMPNMTIMSPKNVLELKNMIKWSMDKEFPIAIRYPRGGDNKNVKLKELEDFTHGKWEHLTDGGEIAIIAVGIMVQRAMKVREKLVQVGIKVTVINACFVKPMDLAMLNELVERKYKIVTIEDNMLIGGFGSTVIQYINTISENTKVLSLGYDDKFIEHGECETLYKLLGLDVEGIFESIVKFI